jgi:large subunit ribosomal protein L1
MAKKAELYEELKKLNKKTKITMRNTIAEMEAELAGLVKAETAEAPVVAEEVVSDDAVSEKAAEVALEVGEAAVESVESTEGAEAEAPAEEEVFTKAGKRSAKAVHEAEAEAERQARKELPVEAKKGPAPKTRAKIERRGRKYQEVAKKVERNKVYSITEAVKLVTETSPVKFDATVEVHARLGVDPKQADQNVRATVVLPHGTGKTVRVAAFVPAEQASGADVAGEAEVLALLDKEQLDFDVLITTPANMPKLGKYARLLGPKGLMPNPKAGTVSATPEKAIAEAKAGKVEYRVDKQGIVHLGIGKVSFGAEKLGENLQVFLDSLESSRPGSLKGNYVLSLSLSSTMGPGVRVVVS